jgi:hypothetical protein
MTMDTTLAPSALARTAIATERYEHVLTAPSRSIGDVLFIDRRMAGSRSPRRRPVHHRLHASPQRSGLTQCHCAPPSGCRESRQPGAVDDQMVRLRDRVPPGRTLGYCLGKAKDPQ